MICMEICSNNSYSERFLKHKEWAAIQTGPGGRLQYEIPGCVNWGSENVPIMKDTLGEKNIPCNPY